MSELRAAGTGGGTAARRAWRTVLWLALGGWLGSWAFFALAVAPTAFRVLPSSQEAGDLVAPLLRSLHCYGMGAGVVAAVALWRLGARRWLTGASLALALLCAVSELGISAAIADVRPRNFGPATDPEAAGRFARLHQASRAVFGSVLLGVIGLVVAGAEPARERANACNDEKSS